MGVTGNGGATGKHLASMSGTLTVIDDYIKAIVKVFNNGRRI
jgi:hypothetical protein